MPAFRIYRDNRTVPVVISIITVCLIYMLLDPSARQVRELQREQAARAAANVGAWPSRPQDHLGSKSAGSHEGAGEGVPSLERLDADDVLLILKTGATVLWKRLPVHLTTTLSSDRIPPDNTVIYSDNEVTIGNHTTVDILAGLPPAVRASPAFETYRAARDWDANNVYAEHAGLPGDGDDGLGPPGGWPLDKYKFLPLVQHAGNRWPAAKWYLYTEDDTYLFLPNVLRHLARYDHRAAHWLGGLGEKLDTTFAHGGSGFALSRGAWERSFGRGGDLTTKYQAMVDAACCGDYALGRVLNDYGVRFGEHGGDEAWSWGWNGLPHWKIEFSRDNWCQPVLTWHHAHSRDIARYHELERSWDFSSRPLNYGDFYARIIAPDLTPRKRWWDNLSSRYEIHSTTVSTAPRPGAMADAALWTAAWRSADSCEAACRGWAECVQWYYYGDDCRLDDRVFMGHGWPEGTRYRKDKLESVSGWLTERVQKWSCEATGRGRG